MIDMQIKSEIPYYKSDNKYQEMDEEIYRDDLFLQQIENINKLTRNVTIDNCINFSMLNVDHDIDSITLIDLPKYIGPLHLNCEVNENLFILNCNSLLDVMCNSTVKRVYIKGCPALKTIKMSNILKELIVQDCENLTSIYASSVVRSTKKQLPHTRHVTQSKCVNSAPIISLNNCPKLGDVNCDFDIINELIVLNCPLIQFNNIKHVNRIYSDLPIYRF